MEQQDQIRAFALRCQGMTWAQIGQTLHYDQQTVSKSLRAVMNHPPRRCRVSTVRVRKGRSGEEGAHET